MVMSLSLFLSKYNLIISSATSITTVDSAYEISMALYEILETAAIAGGVKEGLDDYSSGKNLYDSFIDFLQSLSLAGDPDWYIDEHGEDFGYVTLTDGTVINLGDYITNSLTDGSSALALPDEDTWSKFRVVDGGGSSEQEPDSGDNNENDDDSKTGFSALAAVVFGASFVTALGKYMKDAMNGDVEDVDPDEYLSEGYGYYWKGYYDICTYYPTTEYAQLLGCTYNVNTVYSLIESSDRNNMHNCIFAKYYPCAYITEYDDGHIGIDYVSKNQYGNGSINKFSIYVHRHYYDSSKGSDDTITTYGYYIPSLTCFSFNFPVFDSQEHAYAYINSNGTETTGLLNGAVYDFPALAESVPEVLAPLVNQSIAPAALPKLNTALSTAAVALADPEPAEDLEPNNQIYIDTVSAALTENMPETVPDTDTSTDPEPDPDPAEGEASASDYTVNLTEIFPFCIPFDLIHFLQALDADPVAPCFEIPFVVDVLNIDMVVKLDMSFMDDAVAVFRIGELGCFVIGLMILTSKVIRW
jgi:hypothetical protein